MLFVDRVEAGRRLVERLGHLRGQDVVVLGLPRGGVPVAFEVAAALGAPLDVIVVRKLGVPFQPELGMGAIGEDGVRIVNEQIVQAASITDDELTRVERAERAELARRVERYRGTRPRVPLAGRTAVVVDDGIATGSTARAACQVARAQGAGRVVLAVPVAPPGWTDRLGDVADELVCVATPRPFRAIGVWYWNFTQTTDDEVATYLEGRRGRITTTPDRRPAVADDPPLRDEEVIVEAGPVRVAGHLTIPENPVGVVVFAHGSGSSRHSPRNRYVAEVLQTAGLGTLLFDLLTCGEEVDRAKVFDIELLAGRLVEVTRWLRTQPDATGLPIGYFGASTGATAALWAAAEPAVPVAAVVSRGGLPDLAGARLTAVDAPTLLIVGGEDHVVLDLNRDAQTHLRCQAHLAIVPGATHLFEEPGTLEQAAALARDWLLDHLTSLPQRPDPP